MPAALKGGMHMVSLLIFRASSEMAKKNIGKIAFLPLKFAKIAEIPHFWE